MSSRQPTRDYEYVIYKHPHHRGDGVIVPKSRLSDKGERAAIDFAKKNVGDGAGIYSITHGRFVGWINPNGRFVRFR